MTDIRWQQRFQNFKRAYLALESALAIKSPSAVERAGIIQFYEMAFELSWKLMKDYLNHQGFNVTAPRDSIKQAFQSELISEGSLWIEALVDRNLTVQTYDENKAIEVETAIRQKYFQLLTQLLKTFDAKLVE